jgi:transcriptional regulator with GAF, ATPase, and Fis domain
MTEQVSTFLVDAPGHSAEVDLQVLLVHVGVLLAADAVSLALADAAHRLRVVAATHERAARLQATQTDHYDTYRHAGVFQTDLRQSNPYWPNCVVRAAWAGYRTAVGIPLRLDGGTVGALNGFRVRAAAFSPQELERGGAVAAMTTAALAQQRALQQVSDLAGQLQEALMSRIVIEQAKGILAERLHLDMTRAFGVLRKRARDSNLRLHDVARVVVEGAVEGLRPHGPHSR